LDDGCASSSIFSETVEDWYLVAYFEALDLVIEGIKDQFDQPGYAIYRNLHERRSVVSRKSKFVNYTMKSMVVNSMCNWKV